MAISPYYFGAFCLSDGQNYFLLSKTLDPPSQQYVVANIARLDGTKRSGSKVNERPIQCTVRVVGTTRIDLENKLDALLGALQYREQRLTLHANDPNRYFVADCVDAPYSFTSGTVLWVDVQIKFVCYTPYAFSATQSNYTMAATAFSGSGPYTSPVQTLTGSGNVFCYPTIVITNTGSVQVTQLTLAQQTDGMALTVLQTLNTNDTLTITCDPLAANGLTVSYNNSSPINFVGSFHVIEPSISLWQITATAASAPTMSATWAWVARWAS